MRDFLRRVWEAIFPPPVLGFCKRCGEWTETRHVRVYRNKTRSVESQATCRICGKWRWG